MQILGARILLTGATGGLGLATARELAARGAVLVLSARNHDALEKLAAELPGEHEVIAADLEDTDQARAIVERAGEIDVLIANAGVSGGGRGLADTGAEHARRSVRVNLEAPILMAEAALPALKRSRGQIVLISSVAGKIALPQSSLYSATKAGLRTFGHSLRGELAPDGIGVTVITPGFISEAGMFARRKIKPPLFAGTKTPAQFVAAVVKAIEQGPAEVAVAPPQLRVMSQLLLLAPSLVSRLTGSKPSFRR